jgi:hypothetical protein
MTTLTPIELSGRAQAILEDLLRVRLLTGRQLERLHFHNLSTDNARGSARRRSLGRLVAAQLVTTLPRRVGGERAGSRGLVYQLTARARRLLATSESRIRQPWPIGWPFVQHTLDVAELYVRLREQDRAGRLRLLHFEAEPASWYRSGNQVLKPDAFAVLETSRWEEHYWLEVDRATESLPALRRKLAHYVEAASAPRSAGPLGVTPRVLVTVPTVARRAALQQLLAGLPEPASQLIRVELFEGAFLTEPPGGIPDLRERKQETEL